MKVQYLSTDGNRYIELTDFIQISFRSGGNEFIIRPLEDGRLHVMKVSDDLNILVAPVSIRTITIN